MKTQRKCTLNQRRVLLAVCLLAFFVIIGAISDSTYAACTWNLSDDFRYNPNQENPNRDSCGNTGVWHFMQSATLDRDPQAYSLMTRYINQQGTAVGMEIYGWYGDHFDYNGYFPMINFNHTPSTYQWGRLMFGPKTIHVHPAPSRLAVIGWRSPIDGTVAISGSVKREFGTTAWFIDKGSVNLAYGEPASGTDQTFAEGTGGSNLGIVKVSKNEFIYFVIDPTYDYCCDSTLIDITIASLEPTGTFNRVLPSCYAPGTKLTVTLNATPSSSTNTYALEETPPAGWTVSNISDGGVYESSTNKVKFGAFFDNQSRALKYDLTPSAGTGSQTFAGKVSVNGVSQDITGQTVIAACQLYHPADINQDFRIVMDELTAYGSAWKSGATWSVAPNPIPVDYAIRAASLWKSGEKYKIDFAAGTYPLCWVNDPTRSERSDIRDSASSAVRQMNQAYQAGQAFTVSVLVTPASTVTAYGIEELLPSGWTASGMDNGGSYDEVNNRVKFGPFVDNQARTLTYQVTPSADAKGTYSISGAASFDGNKQPVTGSGLVKDTVDPGDVNGSGGSPNLTDAIIALKVVAGLNPPNVFVSADVNGDNKIGLEEVVYILQKVAGLR